jgi:hypothetical protein
MVPLELRIEFTKALADLQREIAENHERARPVLERADPWKSNNTIDPSHNEGNAESGKDVTV